MATAKPPPRKPAPKPAPLGEGDDRTDPGGPSAETLKKARQEAAEPEVKPGPGDATLVYDKNKGKARGAMPKLVAVAGPKKGTEFPLTEDKTTIGRGSDNVVVIPDISVSRSHVSVE